MSNSSQIDKFDKAVTNKKGVTSNRGTPTSEQKRAHRKLNNDDVLTERRAMEGLSPDKNVPKQSRQTGANRAGRVGKG
jgi:hypothetical protein